MSTSPIGAETFNCYTGTIWYAQLIHQFATPETRERYPPRLLNGEIRAAISITEPDVPGSDPTELKFEARREGDGKYVLNGRKAHAATGSMQQDCEITLVLARTTPDAARHARHHHPRAAQCAGAHGRGLRHDLRPRPCAPYGPTRGCAFENVRVPVGNLLGREGEGFSAHAGGMGIGRIALAMGSIGAAERGLYEMCRWGDERVISGQKLVERQVFTDAVARSRAEIEQCRAYVLRTARDDRKLGMKAVRSEVAQCGCWRRTWHWPCVDRAIQFLGGLGVSHDRPLAEMYAYQRTGPDRREGADEVSDAATWSRRPAALDGSANCSERASAVNAWSGSRSVRLMSGRAVRICSATGCRAGVARPGPACPARRHLRRSTTSVASST